MQRSALALTILTAGCGLVAGLPEFEDAPLPSGSAGSGGAGAGAVAGAGGIGGAPGGGDADAGSGGVGGASQCAPAADWTSSFNSVWTFDSTAPSLGAGVGADAVDLTVGADVESTGLAQQGAAAAMLSGPDGFSSTSTALELTEPSTWGLWLRYRDTGTTSTSVAMARFGPDAGYRLFRGGAARVSCQIGNGITVLVTSGPTELLPGEEWHHVVCRTNADGAVRTLSLTYDGASVTSTTYSETMTPATTFEMGASANPFPGSIDEAFVVKGALTDEAIARVHACGIDGSLCCCDPDDPSLYTACGRYAGSCAELTALVPCDAAAPTTL